MQSDVCKGTKLWWRYQLSFCQSFTCFFHTGSCKWCHTDNLVHCLTPTTELIAHPDFNNWSKQAWPSHTVSSAVLLPGLGKVLTSAVKTTSALLWHCTHRPTSHHHNNSFLDILICFSLLQKVCASIQSLLCFSASCTKNFTWTLELQAPC